MRRTTEAQIAAAITRALARRRNKSASIAELRDMIPHFVTLTRGDKQESPTRPGEALWHQVLRNIRCHSSERRYGLRCIDGGFLLISKPSKAVVETLREIRRAAQ